MTWWELWKRKWPLLLNDNVICPLSRLLVGRSRGIERYVVIFLVSHVLLNVGIAVVWAIFNVTVIEEPSSQETG
jgi:hypothetical protein